MIDEHERERSELAHELHEQVAQALAAVLLGIDSLAPADGPENYTSRIAAVRDQVAKTLDYCRNLAVALRPPLLDQLGLVPALERLAEQAGAEQISLDPSLSGAASVGPALRTGVYRSVEEALATVTGKCILAVSVDSASPRRPHIGTSARRGYHNRRTRDARGSTRVARRNHRLRATATWSCISQ